MSVLDLTLFDSFRATLGGRPSGPFRTRKVQALLAYLAVERSATGCKREKLMALLWPGMPQNSAQSNLRQVIYLLSKTIPLAQDPVSDTPVDFLFSDYQRVQINPAYLPSGCRFFQRTARAGAGSRPLAPAALSRVRRKAAGGGGSLSGDFRLIFTSAIAASSKNGQPSPARA